MKRISLLIIIFLFASCKSYKQIPYFSDLPLQDKIEEDIVNQPVLKIQKNDILVITITSLNPEASAIFNAGNIAAPDAGISGNEGASSLGVNGFLVDQDGAIQMARLGSVKVLGLSTTEARTLIQDLLGKYLKEPVVSLRLANFKISVLGDVAKPGVYPVKSEMISVTEALSLAGDLNITGLRKNVLLVRENEGKRQYIRLDLNSKKTFDSPYYYLRSNDVLYVQPGNAKYASVDTKYRDIGILLSSVSLIILIITRL